MNAFYDVPTPELALKAPQARAYNSGPGAWAADPYRPTPNPATGELTVDPEISLKTKGGMIDIEFYYNSLASENFVYGASRTASIESYVVSNISGGNGNGNGGGAATGLGVVRGNGQAYYFTG